MRGNGQRGRGRGNFRGSHRGRGGGFRGNWKRGKSHGESMSHSGQERGKKCFPSVVGPRLAEADVGITEFISPHSSFSAVIKHRFTDFQVNEIDSDGNIVKLTYLDTPKEESFQSSEIPKRHDLIPEDVWVKLTNMCKNGVKKSAKESKSSFERSSSKELDHPTKVEGVSIPEKVTAMDCTEFKDGSPGEKLDAKGKEDAVIVSAQESEMVGSGKSCDNTLSTNKKEEPSVVASQEDNGSSVSGTMKCNENEPTSRKTPGEEEVSHVELDVTSLDKDSRRAIHLCVKNAFKELNGNTIEKDGRKLVTFSLRTGAKGENRGVWPKSRCGTFLYFVVHKRNMDTTETVNVISQKLGMRTDSITFAGTKDRRAVTSQLMCINRGEPKRLFSLSKSLRSVFFGNYCFKSKPLHLGGLKGNQFRIALRNVQGSDDQINAGMESLKKNGFINYFGLQRFGTNIAVPTHSVGKALLRGDWEKAIDLILEPRETFPNVVAALDEWKKSKNAEASLEKLGPRSSCLEGLLLKGLVKHGPKDLVNALSMLPRNTRLLYLHAYQSFIWNKAVSQRLKEYGLKPVVGDLVLVGAENDLGSDDISIMDDGVINLEPEPDDNTLVEETKTCQEVRCITEEELESFCLADIVLPLPGYDVTYPNNSIGTYMMDLLKEDGLSPDSLKQTVKQYSVKGVYRHIVTRTDKLSWKIYNYNEPEVDFILTDYDEIQKKDSFQNVEGGKFKALVFSMCLEPSTYATMVIREITKQDTSATAQASISSAVPPKSNSAPVEDVKESLMESASGLKRKAEESSNEAVAEKKLKES